jgi:hypothetical protein
MPMKFQWAIADNWIDCTPENNRLLEERRNAPRMEPLLMTNEYGEIWGAPERDDIRFRVHGDEESVTCHIRQSSVDGELPIYAILHPDGPFIFDYATSRALFNDDGSPRASTGPIRYGTETYKTTNGALFQIVNGECFPKRHRQVDVTHGHYKDMTRTRFKWTFQGPLRWNRMTQAVKTVVGNTEDEEKRAALQNAFDGFNPSTDNTEYGPIQFPDHLNAIGMTEVAFQVMEEFKKIPDNEWACFDAITNFRIEEARRQERPVVVLDAEGQKYMIVFDIGTGASGNSAVMIRPTRYQKIIESIEEQFHEAAEEQHKRILQELFELLSNNDINPRLFVMAMMTDEQGALDRLISDRCLRGAAQAILQRMHASDGNLTTRMQQFMPTLLEKFKECDIQLDAREQLHPKPLCPQIAETLREGLAVPESQATHCSHLKDLVQFIQKEQCWELPRGRNTCDICSQTNTRTLTHCGSASACLKCWADSLVKTNMSCPFCRGTIAGGDLKIAGFKKKPAAVKRPPPSRKRKRDSYQRPEDILEEIHKDAKYANISMASKEPMRKWFTILVRRKLVRIGQMPRNGQSKKEFAEAMKIFKLLP